jgi:hypothetical protein
MKPTDAPPRPRPPTVSPHGRALDVADDETITEESFHAILSSHQRSGRWEPADEIRANAILGEVKLDFTRAELPPSGVVDIEAWAIFGEITIIVPDGAEVDLDGTPILGSIEQRVQKKGAGDRIRELVLGRQEDELDDDRSAGPPDDEPAYFRIDGHAIFGTIKVLGR